MFNGRNLVGLAATSNTKFINGCMEILFTPAERAAGYVIDATSKSTRTPLDPVRVKLLKSMTNLSNQVITVTSFS